MEGVNSFEKVQENFKLNSDMNSKSVKFFQDEGEELGVLMMMWSEFVEGKTIEKRVAVK